MKELKVNVWWIRVRHDKDSLEVLPWQIKNELLHSEGMIRQFCDSHIAETLDYSAQMFRFFQRLKSQQGDANSKSLQESENVPLVSKKSVNVYSAWKISVQ